MDKLEELFQMQTELNNKIFRKHGLTIASGALSSEALYMLSRFGLSQGPNSTVNIWLKNFLDALDDESSELRKELLWKWWSNDKLNMQNIRVEIIDILHFWISLAITAGLNADEVMRLYRKKNGINHDRQEQGYSKETKSESDNETIK